MNLLLLAIIALSLPVDLPRAGVPVWDGTGPPQVTVRLVGGHLLKGRLLSLDAKGNMQIQEAGGKNRVLTASEVLIVRFHGATRESGVPAGRLRFLLAGGGLLHGELLKGTYDDVEVRTAAFGTLTLPLERLDRLEIPAAASKAPAGFANSGPKDRDVLFLQRPQGVDHVVGEVARIQKDAILFEWGGQGESRFEFQSDHVVAVRLSDPEIAPVGAGLRARVECRDGSVLRGRLLKENEESMSLTLAWGQRLAVEESQVVSLSFEGGPVRSLSSLRPESIVETPYIEGGLAHGLHVDESLQGGEPSIGGVSFPRALVVHSRCELQYKIPKGAVSFVSALGVDGAVKGRSPMGSVSFTVIVDGEVVYGPTLCRSGEAPRWIQPIMLKDRKSIRLLVDFGNNAHFNGHGVWGHASFVLN